MCRTASRAVPQLTTADSACAPRVAQVPAAKIHEPWTLSREEQQRYGVTIGVDYPNPPKSNWAGFDSRSGRRPTPLVAKE